MTGFRLASGGSAIDRGRPLAFRWGNRLLGGFAGDTLASALLANGVGIVGRSFKYHRPRGVVAGDLGETNALVQLGEGALAVPNVPATEVPLHDGLVARPVNCWPSAAFDLAAGFGLFAPLLGAGFYYKSFMWPSWHWFEGAIRRAAGLGRAPNGADPERYAVRHVSVDVLVVGGGDTGRAEAAAAMAAGRHVMLLDRGTVAPVPGVTILPYTTAVARLDHGLVVAVEALPGAAAPGRLRERLWLIRAGETVLAAGAQERPLVFAGNDRPGIMLAGAVGDYLDRHAVAPGRRIIVAGNNDSIGALAERLRAAGIAVPAVIDTRQEIIVRAAGRRRVTGIETNRRRLACDAIAMSGGVTPALQLLLHSGGGWQRDDAGGLVAAPGAGIRLAGPAFPATASAISPSAMASPRRAKMAFVDFQTDVTLADIAQAVDENYRAPDHLKRYTVLGMGVDQGRLAAANGADALAAITENPSALPTRARPPLVPVAFGTLAAGKPAGELLRPRRFLPAHDFHLARGAIFEDYGWQRPSHYPLPGEDLANAAAREALAVRTTAGLFDASPLGKIRVRGADAGRFLDYLYVGTLSTLAVGRIRYGLMLTDNGSIFDDGVVMRLAADEYLLNASSGHAARVFAHAEELRQCEARHDVTVQDATAARATLALAGPDARAILAAAGTDIAIDRDAFPHLQVRRGQVAGLAALVARVSFSGEVCFEISVATGDAMALATALWTAGGDHGLVPYGIEALEILRIEKGYIHVGSDTDSETQPGDIGFGAAWPKKASDFIGRRSLLRPRSLAAGRRQLVGLKLDDPNAVLPMGAHLEAGGRSIGWVGSSNRSPSLGHGVALALLEAGRDHHGDRVRVVSEGRDWQATVAPPCFLDPENRRLDG